MRDTIRTPWPILISIGFWGLTSVQAEAGGGERRVEIGYEATVTRIAAGARRLEVWVPVPRTDRNQTISRIGMHLPGEAALTREDTYGNQFLYLRIEDPPETVALGLRIEATRRTDLGEPGELSPAERARYLAAEPLVPTDGPVRALALEATRGLTSEGDKARAIQDRVSGMMTYDKSGTGWGRGDAVFACTQRRGNCTDFHALVIGMARSVGLPARFAIGLPLPDRAPSGEVPGYHCWAEIHVAGRGWVPLDSSEAAQHPDRRDDYFGRLDANRLELSRGRHLTLAPPQHGGPLNFLVFPYAEVDGKPHHSVQPHLSYRDLEPSR
jgi:transglutaminase-like putative cysteine protease